MFSAGRGTNLSFGAEAAVELQPRKGDWEICSQTRENGSSLTKNEAHLNTSLKVIIETSAAMATATTPCYYSELSDWWG